MIGTLLTVTGQLRQRQNRNIELLGHNFKASGNFGDFLHTVAVVPAARTRHQLKIIYNDQINRPQAAKLRLHSGTVMEGVSSR